MGQRNLNKNFVENMNGSKILIDWSEIYQINRPGLARAYVESNTMIEFTKITLFCIFLKIFIKYDFRDNGKNT